MADEEKQVAGSSEDSPTGQSDTGEDELTRLRRELEEARSRADDHYRSWQRSAADFANFKRRVDEEKRYAERWLIQDLLVVADDFERAWQTVPTELRRLTWLEGILQIHSKLYTIFQQHGVAAIEAADKEFDPIQHEAVMREEGDPAEHTTVVAELQRGYRLHDRVLRASLVKVGKPKSAPKPDSATPEASAAEGTAAESDTDPVG